MTTPFETDYFTKLVKKRKRKKRFSILGNTLSPEEEVTSF
jgi:hypothetical protein